MWYLMMLPRVFIIRRFFFKKKTGVTHVGGDMFKYIPTADAIFMKVCLSNTIIIFVWIKLSSL